MMLGELQSLATSGLTGVLINALTLAVAARPEKRPVIMNSGHGYLYERDAVCHARAEAEKAELHAQYIDIQLLLAGEERIFWGYGVRAGV